MTNSIAIDNDELKYWAFLSYSRLDNLEKRPNELEMGGLCWGDWLHDALRTFSIPADFVGHPNARGEIVPERIAPIFQDETEQPGEPALTADIRRILEQSRCLVVICSPRSAKSLHVNEAVRYFKQLGRGNRILPIVIAGKPNANEGGRPGVPADDECFVAAMRHPVKPDGSLDTTRREWGCIFADARHGVEKREVLAKDLPNAETELAIAKIQLIAGLIGVGFNGLWRREQNRRFVGFAEARNQVQELQNQAREAENEVEQARNQARAAQNQIQQIERRAREVQNQAEEVQSRLLEAEKQARLAQDEAQAARNDALAAQNRIREMQRQALEAQTQAEQAKSKILEAEQLAREARDDAWSARNQTQEAQNEIQETQRRARAAQCRAEEAQSKVLEAQKQAREAQNRAQQASRQAQEAENRVQEMKNQARDTHAQVSETRSPASGGPSGAPESQNRTPMARRLAKVFALLAVLALLAASIVAGIAWRQRRAASQAMAKLATAQADALGLTSAKLDPEGIRQALRKIGGPEEEANRLRHLDELAARVPLDEIPDALGAAAVIPDDRQRSHFQKQLVLRLARVNPVSAMACASAVEGKVVNDDGAGDSCLYFQLAVLDNWVKTNAPAALGWVGRLPEANSRQRALERIIPALAADNPEETLVRLNDLKPVPGERPYTLLFQLWAAHDPLQAIRQWQQVSDPDTRDKTLCAIMAAWMGEQPEAAVNWLKSQPDLEFKDQAMETCIQEQAKTDVPKALALAESLPDGSWRNTVVAGLFDGWAAKDLSAATAACQRMPDGPAKEKSWERVLMRRIETNPASAAEAVKDLAAGDYRQNAIRELSRHWAETDTAAALAWAQSLPSDEERTVAGNQVVTIWARKAPQAVAQFAREHPDLLSGIAFGAIAEAWSQHDFNGATNWVGSLPAGDKKDAALLGLAGSAEEHAPKLAASYCTQLTTSQPPKELLQGVAYWLAKDDLSNAVDWACSLKDDATRQTALSALSESWAQADPRGMAVYALGLPPGAARARYLAAACRHWAARDLPATLTLLQQLPDADLRRQILAETERNCDLTQINQAAKYVVTLPPGDDQKAAVVGLLAKWAPADPESALNWLCSFPEGNPQTEQVEYVIKDWSQSEPAAAARWLAKWPAGIANEGMVGSFLEGATVKYPEFAAQWTQSVTNESQRQEFQIQVARRWMKTGPAAASKWIDSLDLPPEIKQSLKGVGP